MMSTKKSNHLSYSAKIWATSAIGTPFIAGVIFSMTSQESDLGVLILMAIGVGLVLSIPCFILLTWSSYFVNTSKLEIISKKIILNIIAILLNVILFQIIFLGILGDNNDSLWVILAYSVSLTVGIWMYPLILTPTDMESSPKPIRNQKYLEDVLDDENYGIH